MPAIKEEFDHCPYCGRGDIELDKNDIWTCLTCFYQWNDEGIV